MTTWGYVQRVLAAGALLALLPLFAVLFVLVRATSRGPFLYAQSRPGLHGRPFRVWKVRTMRVGSDADTRNAMAVTRGNPQVTAVGRVLRDLKLDELPQLWNVMRGEMRLVGPRPIAPALHERLCCELPGFERRLDVPPGLTNVGQVCIYDNADADQVVEDWRLRLQSDLHYIANRSFSYDVVLIVMTATFVVRKLVRKVLPARRPPTPAGSVSA